MSRSREVCYLVITSDLPTLSRPPCAAHNTREGAQWRGMVLPLSLLRTSQGHPMLVELKNGETYNGHLVSCDNWMNICLRDVICTSRDGDRFWKLPELVVRGNNIKYLRVPEEARDARPRLAAITTSSGNSHITRRREGLPIHTPFARAGRSGHTFFRTHAALTPHLLRTSGDRHGTGRGPLSQAGRQGQGQRQGQGRGQGRGQGQGRGRAWRRPWEGRRWPWFRARIRAGRGTRIQLNYHFQPQHRFQPQLIGREVPRWV